jgi:hypothetical protein
MYLSKEYHLRSKLEHVALDSLWELSEVVKLIFPASSDFLSGDRIWLFQIGLFSIVEEMCVSIERKSSGLQAGSSSSLFWSENWISFWEENFLLLRLFKVKLDCVCSKLPCSGHLKKHLYHSKENHYVRSRRIWHTVSLWELSICLKEIPPKT